MSFICPVLRARTHTPIDSPDSVACSRSLPKSLRPEALEYLLHLRSFGCYETRRTSGVMVGLAKETYQEGYNVEAP